MLSTEKVHQFNLNPASVNALQLPLTFPRFPRVPRILRLPLEHALTAASVRIYAHAEAVSTHSARNATIGSVDTARRDGAIEASMLATMTIAATAP